MTEKAAKAENSIKTTCAKLGLSENGKRWFDLAVDPFKDLQMPTAGFPDNVTIPSVVQTIHESLVITNPASVPAGNWDCNIFIDQLYNSVNLSQTTMTHGNSIAEQSSQIIGATNRGGLIVRSGSPGTPLDIRDTKFSLSLKQDVLSEGDVRVIAIGLEIHNTTAELQKQGSLICYRVPDAPVQNQVVTCVIDNGITACIPTGVDAVELLEVPYTASAAIDLPGSVQWEAKDGAYIVPVMSESENPPMTPRQLAVIADDTNAGQDYFSPMTVTGAAKIVTVDAQNFKIPFSVSGCYLSGLSHETTLQVNLTYYVEIFPTKDSVLRRSVQPATGLDAQALCLYNHVISKLPTGVEVSDNFLGAFISGVARIAGTIARVVPSVVRTVGSVGNAVSAIGNAMNFGMDAQSIGSSIPVSTEVVTRPTHQRRREVPVIVEQSIVPYNPPKNVAVVSEQVRRSDRGNIVETRVIAPTRNSVSTNNGTRKQKTRIAQKKQNAAIRNASQGYAGNRWIDNH